ncbi:MAG: signal recognition particle protein, partial [Alphaproteobacteria bacterium]|nr:signal recognition particle protein [Alphaproteobacteria bacterium]NDE18992.1 signal recognition particle protein [Alphaproteobacteria bacterium]
MFQTLTQNLTKIFDKIKGAGALTEAHIDSAMRDIRIALLEADVALPVVRAFISEVSEKAKGVEVVKSVSPAQMVIKIINDEMIRLLQPDENESKINLQSVPPVNLLIVGLQGSGKTTASAKLALKLKSTGKKVLLVSLDTYRPAAQDQLEILAKSIEVDSLPIIKEQLPIAITERAITAAKLSGYDVVIYDTAGRLHIDDDMINEAIKVKSLVKPTETFLVMDAMIGQDAVNVASNFNHKLDITGVILSRIDGDSKGGAALSVRYITGKPIKFLSTGEKPDEFEEFDAKRIASRILDMGDVVSFVERAASVIDRSEAEKTAAKLKKGQFDLDDYISQIKMIKKMGGLGSMMNFLPGISKLSDKIGDLSSGEKALVSQMAIVNSMTKKERKNPDILNASRKKRVATGSGTTVQQVNILLKQFKQISTTMKKVSR